MFIGTTTKSACEPNVAWRITTERNVATYVPGTSPFSKKHVPRFVPWTAAEHVMEQHMIASIPTASARGGERSMIAQLLSKYLVLLVR
jgi:hypothetical protein